MAGFECNTFSFSFFFVKKIQFNPKQIEKKKYFYFSFWLNFFFLSELIQSLKGGKFPQLKKRV